MNELTRKFVFFNSYRNNQHFINYCLKERHFCKKNIRIYLNVYYGCIGKDVSVPDVLNNLKKVM